ncbi:MAG: c-type cytochrome [Proteobacteria bacterium]|nr:c-type cytochrome [Pseudomonadota bacterium]
MRRRAKLLAATAVGMVLATSHVRAAASAARGEELYQSCQDCHSLDSNDIGPKHRGVFGRKAGAVPDYNYSAALKASGITWNEDSLDKWLTDPQKLVPGAKMFFHIDTAQDRADIIEYLKERAK